ncbi:hypothetical protein FRACYDRAFT_249526 [Fragilariopsis cylindrus CCMP1102]|uniref:DUF6824 domain-containing protein n=1 Tax=Fragilariopsis cylindrus CCMP1102 TaxID=635003 RepID=A0A1E7ERY3_9STRA|nr:hypothetical protein FRACYDRAFT_249526 [Fragilariopsis cylindrus CCMP1102]|eukprot:OEU08632.1 hypothetical protein FRACYDRAFT_249526 [Fragilariopsis cylindrus CCMP1102]
MPTANDVLCGRGKSCNNHSGNIQFISIVKDHVQTYMNLSSRFEKTLLKSNNNNNNNKSSQAIKKMKQQQQQRQQMTPIAATTTICFEPIQCHSTEDLCDHCITARSLSLKTSDLLTSILNVVETTTAEEDEVNDYDCLSTKMLMMTALPPPLPPQRTRYVSEESCAFLPAPVLSSSSSSSSLYDDR